MKEIAEVTAVEGNRVTVTTELKTACSGCAQVSNCGAGILSKVFADRNAQFTVVTEQAFRPGELVQLEVPDTAVTRFALLLYGLPILMLLLIAVLLENTGTLTEGFIILLSFAGFALTFWGLKRWFRKRDIQVNAMVKLEASAEVQHSNP
ncbi:MULTISPECIES: SoxR reducing system RseC family protein [Idiomarina]|jgi:sigma-E factor negative regulatory protein RseC|uniref:SoxR reducing system RseC family protein n=1 Tax=Idiomarina TaxID=135575 RepID=UPI0006C841C1|nr:MULTISPECIES: SoxR reducing system RseC family protein [Idiomarina]KPD22815.1 positive regulator of sigma E activity [Idiomarina abyssalis]MAO68030.1 Fis family transcriptional regulator [Idiomarina sp.]MBE91693.1 Fis family transcriptional regulator [Idiomarina sp.]MBF79782.1 Fis family transcriptional regulator [Idiomarina sp.]QZN89978.1 SoxR reducing system RseC family protein [Idiomarina abyssalis]|tara:strand:- start:441 stop:890 length:450 start_codon:yes stop_codon:yes gene_type:complete